MADSEDSKWCLRRRCDQGYNEWLTKDAGAETYSGTWSAWFERRYFDTVMKARAEMWRLRANGMHCRIVRVTRRERAGAKMTPKPPR